MQNWNGSGARKLRTMGDSLRKVERSGIAGIVDKIETGLYDKCPLVYKLKAV